jgi:hypothetical protein
MVSTALATAEAAIRTSLHDGVCPQGDLEGCEQNVVT